MNTAQTREIYELYLNSPEWRARRNHRLRAARWRCERCGGKRDLQVHHRTYARLGCELDTDLQVLCVGCHEQEHIRAMHDSARHRIYLKLATEALRAEPFASIADLSEETKRLCAQHHIPYDGPAIHRAIGLMTGTRIKPVLPKPNTRARESEPPSIAARDAHEILMRLGLGVCLREMPDTELPEEELQIHEERVRRQAQVFRGLPLPKPPIHERLDEIFARSPRD